MYYDLLQPATEVLLEALNHYLNCHRRPPSRFLVGIALFFVTLLSWLAINESARYSIIVELSGFGLLILSFLLMKSELEYLTLGGATQDIDREECERD